MTRVGGSVAVLAAMWLLSACGQPQGEAEKGQGAAQATVTTQKPDANHPIVVELYQSQGCSSCPPANANLNRIADRDDVIALSFAVTYWDDLGWKDRFADPAFTRRQRDFADANGRAQVWTPQMVVNGEAETLTGVKRDVFDARIDAARGLSGGPSISGDGKAVALGAADGGPATVWLVRYDPAERDVAIAAGENAGRTLPHRNIVRSLVALGEWHGDAVDWALPPAAEPGLSSAILVQRGKGGPIIAARRIDG